MSLKEKIKIDIMASMKAKDSVRLSALRNINAKIMEMEKLFYSL